MEYKDVQNEINEKFERRNLLLGNGFSMSYNSNCFSSESIYNSFLENINPDLRTWVERHSSIYNIHDVESLLEYIDYTNDLISITQCSNVEMSISSDEIEKSRVSEEELDELRQGFIKAIAQAYANSCQVDKRCTSFLRYFLDSGCIFSTNYDLLLSYEIANMLYFRNYLTRPERFFYSERIKKYKQVNYLHGSLCQFEDETKPLHENPKDTIEQITRKFDDNYFSSIVLEPLGKNKLTIISKSSQLSQSYISLMNIMGALVVFGLRFNDSDNHLIKAINLAANPKAFVKEEDEILKKVYISYYNEEDKNHLLDISQKIDCEVALFDASSAEIWES